MSALQWRREFYEPAKELGAEDKIVGHVDGDVKTVALAEPPQGALARFKLLNPPDIRMGDHVRYDDGETEPFTAVVMRVGRPYPSGTFNVDLLRDGVTATVFCEHCTVVFRPRRRAWDVDAVLKLFEAGPEITLFGHEPVNTVKGARADGSLTVSFWSGDVKVDSKVYSEKEYGYLRNVLRTANAWIFAQPVKVGDFWTETINQGRRDVEVVAVKKLRYRIEYEMPNAGMMGSWQTGILIGGKLYA